MSVCKEIYKITKEQLLESLERNYYIITKVANEFGCVPNVIYDRITKFKITDPRLLERRKLIPYNAWPIDSIEKAYTLGFILCDGHITIDHRMDNISGRLVVSAVDEDVIRFIGDELNSPVYYKTDIASGYCKGRVYNYYMTSCTSVNVIRLFGGRLKEDRHIPSYMVPFPLLPAFILGMFDADGSLDYGFRHGNPMAIRHGIEFTSSKNIIYELQFIVFNILNISSHVEDLSISKRPQNAARLRITGRYNIITFLNWIYQYPEFHPMQRKWIKAVNMVNDLNSKQLLKYIGDPFSGYDHIPMIKPFTFS